MKFENINQSHAQALLRFEFNNRQYFESMIAPRPEGFFTIEGIQAHIDELACAHKKSSGHSLVLLDGDEIMARANIKNINAETKSAEIGYRVAETHLGKGIASTCVSKLIQVADDLLSLESLCAYVLENNPASARVLVKNQFKQTAYLPEYISHKDSVLDCVKYERAISP